MSTWMLAVCLSVGIATAQNQLVTVNRVIIVGNETVGDQVIRRCVNIAPGDSVNAMYLNRSQGSLVRLGVFQIDPQRGVRPTIRLIRTETPGLYDVLIYVQEKPATPR
jgi:outer membrane protein assembly factor BamA